MPNVRNKKILLLLASVITIAIIFKIYRNTYLQKSGAIRQTNFKNTLAIDSFNSILKVGDIVFRHGADAISDLFCKMNKTDRTFSHLGIVLQSKDSLMVYHSIGGEDNPDEKIRMENFKTFVTPNYNTALGFMRIPMTTKNLVSLDSVVKKWHTEQRTFDMKFDLQSDEKLYCAEFVYKAFRIATADTNLFSTTKAKELIYVAPDNILLEKKRIAFGKYIYQ